MALVFAISILGVVFALLFNSRSTTSTQTTSVDICGLLSPSVMDNLALNGAGREIPGLNQSAPPWDYQSIRNHIHQGWDTVCQSESFVSAVQEHGPGFSSGGSFINAANPNASAVAIVMAWAQNATPRELCPLPRGVGYTNRQRHCFGSCGEYWNMQFTWLNKLVRL